MNYIKIDPEANIIPNKGLANVLIGQSLYPIIGELMEFKETKGCAYDKSGTVFLMWNTNKEIVQISALAGYRGTLDEGIKVGDPIKNLIEKGWKFEEDIDAFVNGKFGNVLIRTNLEDATMDEISSGLEKLTIAEISVSQLP